MSRRSSNVSPRINARARLFSQRLVRLLIFHAHPNAANVKMSGDDLASAHESLPRFQLVFPDRPHGSIVFGEESVDGVILMLSEPAQRFSVRLIEDHHNSVPIGESSRKNEGIPPRTESI